MKLPFHRFDNSRRTLPVLERDVDSNFGMLNARMTYVPVVVRTFVNATSAAVLKYLPNGNTSPDKDYHYIKTDSSANTVTIYPFGTQLVMGTTSLVLTVQGDSAWLVWDHASQGWWLA